ncbi:MAG: phospholipase D-like domain-containing protein [Polyangiales bacterium]
MIHPDALAIVHELRARGHRAYITGGAVRDLILRRYPRDFDVATTADEGEVAALLGGSGDDAPRWTSPVQVTVARGDTLGLDVLPMADPPWVPGEVWARRARSGDVLRDFAESFDFTVNALLYDPVDDALHDYVDGVRDLESRVLRRVCDRGDDFAWDPVSIVRGAVLASRLGLTLDATTRVQMQSHVGALRRANAARLAAHLVKLLASGRASPSLSTLRELGALDAMFPRDVAASLRDAARVDRGLRALDAAPREGAPVSLLLSALLVEPARDALRLAGINPADASRRFDAERDETPDEVLDAMLAAMDHRFPMPRRVWTQTRAALLDATSTDAPLRDEDFDRLARVARSLPRSGSHDVLVGPEGFEDTLLARLASARASLRVMAYQLDRDAVLDGLAQAADRGVSVRVLLDAAQPMNEGARAALTARGVEVRWAPAAFTHAHAKVIAVDEREALVLSANLIDESMESERNWSVTVRDTEALDALREVFECDWRGDAVTRAPEPLLLAPINARAGVEALIGGAKARLDLAVMSLSDQAVLDAVVRRAAEGVRVRAILADPGWIASNEDAAEALTGGGAEVRFLADYDLHGKLVIADGCALVGSINLSSTSLDRNREVGLLVCDDARFPALAASFEADWDASAPVED